MKTKLIGILLLGILTGVSTGFSQGFTPPSEGKTVVYFTRVTSYGFAAAFDFFDQDKYIGNFKGKNYLRYECEPGEHLFWASSENKEFITADLKEGETYIIMVNVIIGVKKAQVGLGPIASDSNSFEKAQDLINKKKEVVISEKEIDAKTKKLEKIDFMSNNLDKYENEWKDSKNFRHLSADMAIPKDLLNK